MSNSGDSTERKEKIDVSVLDSFIRSWLDGLRGGGNNEHPEVPNSHQSYDRLPNAKENDDNSSLLPGKQAYVKIISQFVAYRWLIASLKRDLLPAPVPCQRETCGRIFSEHRDLYGSHKTLSSRRLPDTHFLSLLASWDAKASLRSQFDDWKQPHGQLLAQTITLTGSASDAQATPCEKYTRQMWPALGPNLLSLLVRVLDTVLASPTGLGNAEHTFTIEPGPAKKENTIDANDAEALRKALTAGDRAQVESLLADDSFDGIAQGEFAWLLDLKETGSSIAEMTQVLFNTSRSTECSLVFDELPDLDFEPTSEELPEDYHDFWDFHQTTCAHRTPNQGDALSFDPISLHLRRNEMQRQVAALCGLGGLIPRNNQQDEFKGLTLTESNACVVYGAEQDWSFRGGESGTHGPKGEEAWPSLPVRIYRTSVIMALATANNPVIRELGICLVDWK